MPGFLCKHRPACYLETMLEKDRLRERSQIAVLRFFPSEDGTVVCEVDAPSRGVFRERIISTGYALASGEEGLDEA